MSRAYPRTSFRSVVRHEPPLEEVIWALLERRRGRVHYLKSSRWRRRGNIPGTSQAIKTACAIATLEPLVTEGERCSRTRGHLPVYARKKFQ
jgi:hypothetical protein